MKNDDRKSWKCWFKSVTLVEYVVRYIVILDIVSTLMLILCYLGQNPMIT